MAVRFRQLTAEEWPLERIRERDVIKRQKSYDGRVMFPSSHDITPANLDACMTVIGNLLGAGNELLVVSKPRIECIDRICREFHPARDRILFRFTIGATDDEILAFWEPGAPTYAERRDSLCLAHEYGFETSVSIEPMLDIDHVIELVADLQECVTNAIWIGKMNHIKKSMRLADEKTKAALEGIGAQQTNQRILEIHEQLKSNPKIKWKEGIKKIVGIDIPDEYGLDQ
jgi:DNA repair photolyase